MKFNKVSFLSVLSFLLMAILLTFGCSKDKDAVPKSLQFTDPTKLIEKYYDLVRQYDKDTLSNIVVPDLMAKFNGGTYSDEANRLATIAGRNIVVKNIELGEPTFGEKTGNEVIVANITFDNDAKQRELSC